MVAEVAAMRDGSWGIRGKAMSYGLGYTRGPDTSQMRHRINVETATTEIDSARQKVVTYVTRLAAEPAAFMQVSGGETIRGRQIEAGVTALFKVNYRTGYAVTDRVQFDGQAYGIVRLEIPQGVKRFMWLHCKGVV